LRGSVTREKRSLHSAKAHFCLFDAKD